MKRDIKVNYGVLQSIVDNLSQYKKALENMDSTLKRINTKLENENDGEAVNALKNKYKEIKGQLDSCHEEVSDLYDIFNNYIIDMTGIIKPKNYDAMMRVSRNDIYWNMETIISACSGVMMTRRNAAVFRSFPSPFASNEEKAAERRNGNKLEEIYSDIISYGQKLMNDVSDMQNLYNKKIIPYENMDDTYKSKAKSVYSKYTNFLEGLKTNLTAIGVGAVDLVKGVAASLIGLVKGVWDLVKGVVTYLGAGIGIACTTVFGDAPDCLKNCKAKAEEYNKTIGAILKDPFLIVEGISQNVNDAYEEKGICYVTGYAAGEIAQLILLKKAGDKIKNVKGADGASDAVKGTEAVDGLDDAAKAVDKVDDAADAVKNVENAAGISDKTLESIQRAIATGTEETWNEFVKANPGRNLDELSKAYIELVEGQSPWPEGFVPKENVLKGGDTIEMALDSSQPITSPGNFATTENAIKDVDFVRNNLAVKSDWKADCSKVVTYRVKEGVEIPILEGPVGPQIDINANKYLPGGGYQMQMLLDRSVNKMDYLEVVSVRTIN